MSIEFFKCLGCGACCRIKDGIVRVSDEEIARISSFLGMTPSAFIRDETELSPDRKGLVLKSREDGACSFLTAENKCAIHAVKPDKCKSFPYEWTNPDSYEVCPGLCEARFFAAGEKS
jgi:Fe-S-cluster containining protein